MTKLDSTVVRGELRVLRRLIEEVEPGYAKSAQVVPVADDVPFAEKAYWEEIGYLDTFLIGMKPPHAVDTEATLAKLIGLWRKVKTRRSHWGADGATRAALPAKCRVLSFMLSRPMVTLVDETEGLEDPPVVRIDKDGERQEEGPFLHNAVETTVLRLFATRLFNIHVPASLVGEPMMPTVQPHLSKLGEGVWRMVPIPERLHAMGAPREFVGYTSYRVLVDFLAATADRGWVRIGTPRADRYDLDAVPEALLTSNRLTTIRDARAGTTFRAGYLAERPVIMIPEGEGESIYVQPEDRAAVVKETKRHGAPGALIERLDDLYVEVDGKRVMRLI